MGPSPSRSDVPGRDCGPFGNLDPDSDAVSFIGLGTLVLVSAASIAAMTDTTSDSLETVLVVNPRSGSGDHVPAVRDRATVLGYRIEETQRENHAMKLAEAAVEDGVDEVVAVGGDGTLNEVVRGVDAADGLDSVTVGVVPAGTGNDFATNIGITDIDVGFQALEDGERRWLDLGMADGTPFINSCLAGIVAEASDATTPEMKSRLGVLAYVMNTVQLAAEFSGIELSASVVEDGTTETVWEGVAEVVLVGNGRRFTLSGSEQANVEDGLLDVTIVEETGSIDLLEERLQERFLGREGEHIVRLLASSLELVVHERSATSFSLDGEFIDARSLELTTRERVVRMPVGESYDPSPGGD